MSDTLQVTPTPVGSIPEAIQALNTTFDSGKTIPIEWRKVQLKKLWQMLDVQLKSIRLDDI